MSKVKINPAYNADSTIIQRTYGIVDLKKYLVKIKQNIKVFEEAINKEKTEIKRVKGMINALKTDIVNAKELKRLYKK
ncbi:MAG: hypothetical protein UR68_C0015G0023 [Candidatus Roizmanbacteria bacterium GW2011_GWA2_35_19]|uniref:Uncharacterized protein n=1 Tax=Candidatus Roizmanbacteria bacterium GW2011_GWA2_35_19 TaxID=1618478 RepID=A0A0G0EZ91_9BACT|nr:MAG: hypothetical protein UR68_C0015G0023 [Candidatus Roizmanbacteria bacterium GW2011_GWA2_35_19]